LGVKDQTLNPFWFIHSAGEGEFGVVVAHFQNATVTPHGQDGPSGMTGHRMQGRTVLSQQGLGSPAWGLHVNYSGPHCGHNKAPADAEGSVTQRLLHCVCVCWGLFMFVLLYKRDLNGRCYQIFDQINLITSSKEEMKILASMFVSKVTQIWTTFGRIVGHWPRHIWVTFHTNWQQGGMAMHVDSCVYVSIDHLGMMHRFALYMWMEG
jgi:hypothetical protein